MQSQYLPVAILSETLQITTKTNLSALAMTYNDFKKDSQKVAPNQENTMIKTIKNGKQNCWQLTILAESRIQRTYRI